MIIINAENGLYFCGNNNILFFQDSLMILMHLFLKSLYWSLLLNIMQDKLLKGSVYSSFDFKMAYP